MCYKVIAICCFQGEVGDSRRMEGKNIGRENDYRQGSE